MLLWIACAGCQAPIQTTEHATSPEWLVMLPGVEGGAWQLAGMKAGLKDAGYKGRIEIIEWGVRPFGSIANLTDLPLNKKRANDIALRIRSIKNGNPDSAVTLVGYSGGGGLATLVTERLDEHCKLDRLILIAAALSPQYDLSAAAKNCTHGMVNFYSPRDMFTLGAGTSFFGTIDRYYGDAAGKTGFRDAKGDILQRPDLRQISWDDSWMKYSHYGSHVGWLANAWAKEVLALQLSIATTSSRA